MLHEDKVHIMPMTVFVALVNVINCRISGMADILQELRTFTKTFSAEFVYFVVSLYPEVYISFHDVINKKFLLFSEKSTMTKVYTADENWDDYIRDVARVLLGGCYLNVDFAFVDCLQDIGLLDFNYFHNL